MLRITHTKMVYFNLSVLMQLLESLYTHVHNSLAVLWIIVIRGDVLEWSKNYSCTDGTFNLLIMKSAFVLFKKKHTITFPTNPLTCGLVHLNYNSSIPVCPYEDYIWGTFFLLTLTNTLGTHICLTEFSLNAGLRSNAQLSL